MKLLSVASECYPLIKTGGLADVAGALPKALAALGVKVTTFLPLYGAVKTLLGEKALKAAKSVALTALGKKKAQILFLSHEGLDLALFDCPDYFARAGAPYTGPNGEDWPDNGMRFAAFSEAAARLALGDIGPKEGFDIVHCHDWQAGLTPAYLAAARAAKPNVKVPKSVMTIHNIAFQGRYELALFEDLNLPDWTFHVDGLEYYGGLGYLKAGLFFADFVTTVSPTYAREICRFPNGMGLEGLLSGRGDRLIGIVNGIDVVDWDPATDKALAQHFDASHISNREKNRLALKQHFGLKRSKGPIFSIITRLTHQKGIDVLMGQIDHIIAKGGFICALGSGDKALEHALLAASVRHKGKVGVFIGYNEQLARQIQAGTDCLMVPSRNEPCGLTQLCALRYGAVPLVVGTGGLADTIVHANGAAIAAGVGTGIVLPWLDDGQLFEGINRLFELFAQKEVWRRIIRNGMKSDVSWTSSAAQYVALYNRALSLA